MYQHKNYRANPASGDFVYQDQYMGAKISRALSSGHVMLYQTISVGPPLDSMVMTNMRKLSNLRIQCGISGQPRRLGVGVRMRSKCEKLCCISPGGSTQMVVIRGRGAWKITVSNLFDALGYPQLIAMLGNERKLGILLPYDRNRRCKLTLWGRRELSIVVQLFKSRRIVWLTNITSAMLLYSDYSDWCVFDASSKSTFQFLTRFFNTL